MRLLAADRARAAGLKPISGEPGLPLLQRNLDVLRGTWMNDLSLYERYRLVSWSRALGQERVLAMGPEAAAALLTKRDKTYANGPGCPSSSARSSRVA